MTTTFDYAVTNYSSQFGFVTPDNFGAKGDGISDDSFPLQQWLDSPIKHKLLGGLRYRTTKSLFSTVNGAYISGPGTIFADTTAIDVLNVSGNNSVVVDIEIDGNDKARYLIYSSGAGNVIQFNNVHDAYSSNNSARGIYSSTAGGVIIRGNKISNIHSPGNANAGDGNGLSRAIMMHSLTTPTAPSLCIDNIVDNITGEEADAISVLYSDTVVTTYLSGDTIIRGNMIRNSGRRYIKIQGSNIIVDANRCWSSAGYVPENPSAVIDVIQGKNILISNNRVEETGMSAPVAIAGATGERVTDITIVNNYLSEGDNLSPCISLSEADNVTISGNTLIGGNYYVSGGTSSNVIVNNNACRGGNVANVSFNFTSSVSGKVRGNVIPTGRAVGTSASVVFDGNS